jgi:hypothetical protein
VEDELLKMEKYGQFPDVTIKIKDTQMHYLNIQTY